jgi:hypothetical protein
MKNLSLDDVIEIYLGNSSFQGMEINKSKELAYNEIKRRSIDYQAINKVTELQNNYNQLLCKFPAIEKVNSITFIDNCYENSVYNLSVELRNFCLKSFQPQLCDLLSEINEILSTLDKIWEYDPEHLRYISKFFERRALPQSQEYYTFHDLDNIIFTKSKILRYQISATLGFDSMKSILLKCYESEITFLPISITDWAYNRELVLNFIISFNSMTSVNCSLWILFLANNQMHDKQIEIEKEIISFIRKLKNKRFSLFEQLPFTAIEQKIPETFNFGLLANELDNFGIKSYNYH